EIIAREGHQAAHVVGVSLGTLIAQDVAARFPDAVASLTVVGGYPIAGDTRALQRAQSKEMLKWLGLVLVSMPRFRRYVANTSAIDPQARGVFLSSAQLFTRRSFRAMAGLDSIMRPAEQPIRHPLQIIVGQHELPILRAATAAWHGRESGSEYHIIANAGHCANMDNPAEFNARLDAFLARHSAARPARRPELVNRPVTHKNAALRS
ncbi:MAG TPA: alpha/beta hydrolase, partial [Herpetosiphonaceae bacterium]|nr:alpha/beta hydrolase [Herpetosiphonaceae bacterium]